MSLIEIYFDLQEKYETQYGLNTVVFIEKGSFYEIYGIDNETTKKGQANIISSLLNIQLTRANKKILENSIKNPLMTGFPSISLKKNVKVLLDHNFTIITYDQKTSGANADREITMIYSPGTYINDSTTNKHNNVCSIYIDKIEKHISCGLSFIDISTGECKIYETSSDDSIYITEFINRITESYDTREYILSGNGVKTIKKDLSINMAMLHFIPINLENEKNNYQNEILKKVYKKDTLISHIEYFDLERVLYGTISFVYLLQFCYEHNETIVNFLNDPEIHNDDDKLILNNNAVYQINVLNSNIKEKGCIQSLYDVVNFTSTPMGKRLLHDIITNPITNVDDLNDEYEKVNKMIGKIEWYENKLNGIRDIDRFNRKIALGIIQPSELANLQNSYEKINIITQQSNCKFQLYYEFYNEYLSICDIDTMSKYNINDIQENIFNKGVFEEIDKIQINIDKYMLNLENECKNISNLLNQKENIIKFDISKSGYSLYSTSNRCDQLKKIAKDKYYFKKETKTKCVISSDKINKNIDNLTKNQLLLKPKIIETFNKVILDIHIKYGNVLKEISYFIAKTDVLKSKAKCAITYNYVKPEVFTSNTAYIEASAMRHAIIECLDTDTDYVENNVLLNDENSGILLYGVNGSGKSCYSKAIGLCIVLAQSGHFVPCSMFKYSPFTKLFTRISGDDNIFKGQSSFFLEMTELKSILKYSDQKSIIIGDEICKGTEDISAVSIVGTTMNVLLKRKAKFIFATHLHKLPSISILKDCLNLRTMHISVDFKDSTIFSRKLKEGTGDLLYGLEIAHSILQDESFHQIAYKLRNDLIKKSDKIVAAKKSKYNSNLYVDHCEICESNDKLEAHHIIFQSKSNVRKNRKSNLVVLCDKCHHDVHSNNINIYGWLKTTNGKKLDFENNS